MKLLIDIGNTRAKWALLNASEGVECRGFFDIDSKSLNFKADTFKHVKQAWISCVNKRSKLSLIEQSLKDDLGIDSVNVAVTPSFGELQNNYQALGSLGVDRWVAAIGAHSAFPDVNVIIVDAGTAVTVDMISFDCENGGHVFKGGVIMPGLQMMHHALVGNTAGIKSVITPVQKIVGATTQECVNAGVQYGLVGAVEKVVDEMRSELKKISDGKIEIVICGGDAHFLESKSSLPLTLFEDLIFHGLKIMSNAAV